MIRFYLVCLPNWIFVDYIFVRLNLTWLPANNLRRISTMYVQGYLQGCENGRVVTIVSDGTQTITNVIYYLMALKLLQMSFTIWWSSTYYKCHLLSDGAQPITHAIYYLMALKLLHISFTIWWSSTYYTCHLPSDGTQTIAHTIWWHSNYCTCHSLSDDTQPITNVIY